MLGHDSVGTVHIYTEIAPDEKIMDVCEENGITIDFDVVEDADKLREQLKDYEFLDERDVTSFCNKQLGIQFEKTAIQR